MGNWKPLTEGHSKLLRIGLLSYADFNTCSSSLLQRSSVCLQPQEGMAQQSRQFHWDKRKRQYIQLQPGEKVKAGKRLKTESGASVAAKKGPSGLYKKWSKAHQTRIAPVGQMEDEKAGDGSGLADRSDSVSFRLASPPCAPCPLS